jgi:hypothetical protein
MASQRLTDKALLSIQPAKDDLLMVVDVSSTTGSPQGTSKKIEARNVIAVEEISLSSAQIQALHTTPVELIAAPGSSYAIMVHSVLVNNTYVSVTETNRRTGQIAYGTPATFANEIFRIESWMRNATTNVSRRAAPGFAQNTVAENQPLKIAADLAITGNFTSTIYIAHTIIKL